MKPRLFVGSSTESLPIAYAIQENLEHAAEVTVWNQGLFDPSSYTLDALATTASDSDFGAFVFAPDDIIRLRGEEKRTARDNVVFEIGLFIGSLGRERCFIVLPTGTKNFRLPSDLLGVTPLNYVSDRQDGNLIASLGPACNKIKRAFDSLEAV